MADNKTHSEAGLFEKSSKDPLSIQLANLNIDMQNILSIFAAVNDAITGTAAFAKATIIGIDGNKKEIAIPASSYLYREIQRISRNMETLLGLEGGGSTIIDASGNARTIKLSTLLRSLPGDYDAISKANYAKVDVTSAIFDLMYPCPKIEFTLPQDFICNQVKVTKIRLENLDEINLFTEGQEYQEVKGLCDVKNILYTETTDVYNIDTNTDNLYGSFSILQIQRQASGNINLVLDKLTYSDIRSLTDSRELAVGDLLCDKEGNGVYKILSIDKIAYTVTVQLISGFDKLEAGVRTLWYQYDSELTRTVSVPIQANERSLVFLSPINPDTNTTNGISKSFIINTENLYIVNSSNSSVLFDTWFNNSVTNIGNYLQSVAEDATIPLSFGIKPDTPVLDPGSFQVVQINKHLTDTSDVERVKALATEKEQTFSKINTVTKRISTVNKRINSGRYRSLSDKNDDLTLLQNLNSEKEQLTAAYESLVKDIISKTENVESAGYDPKYRIRGFWAVQSPIPSSHSRDQHIIHYIVEYRYLNARENVSNASIIKYKENDQYRTGVFSSWNRLITPTLTRVRNADGTYSWKDNKPEDSNSISINQCDIPISINESVEIRVKACSEAGYPSTMLESDWSDILRVDFPAELTREASLSQTIADNKEDQKKIQVEQLIREKGLDQHISSAYTEQERYFAHTAAVIASGFYTQEQKTIPLLDFLTDIKSKIESVYDKVFNKTPEVTVDIVDESGISYNVQKNATVNLFAGYYQDTVDFTNKANYGKVVTKTFYIRLQNLTAETLQLFSRYPGRLNDLITPDNVVEGDNYNNIPMRIGVNTIGEAQHLSQIVYLKNHDIYGANLYQKQEKTVTITENNLVTENVEVDQREIAYFDNSGTVQYAKFLVDQSKANYNQVIGLHKSYPKFNMDSEIKRVLNRTQFSDVVNISDNKLGGFTTNVETPNALSFQEEDTYMVGTYSCGARLYMNPPTRNFIQVNGINENAYRELQTGTSNAILIPIVFEYRMTDRIGNPGIENKGNSVNFTYRKKISVELYLNKQLVEFDLEISAQYKNEEINASTISATKRKNVTDAVDSMDSVIPTIQ